MGQLHAAYPEVDFYFTERSTFGVRGIDEILQYFRHGAKSYNAWVTCLWPAPSEQPARVQAG